MSIVIRGSPRPASGDIGLPRVVARKAIKKQVFGPFVAWGVGVQEEQLTIIQTSDASFKTTFTILLNIAYTLVGALLQNTKWIDKFKNICLLK
jgi:hypothetical protein